ncbi:cellulase family glycosylhydrolase [bacterium]|nr:cellulase family glycosylhydrolase [bacterium]
MPAQTVLPRWRGFNLLEMFTSKSTGEWEEDDFRWIADWGFDFVRLPMCYLLWIEGDDVYKLSEAGLARVDRAVELGQKYHLHVNLNFHRGPGYSVNREREEPFNLWKDEEALQAFCFHWGHFAQRYKGIGSDKLSFNLVNEPASPSDRMSREDHERVMRATVARIRAIDPERLVLLDGLSWGNDPCPELADLGVAQSCRAYVPMQISHYRASWVNSEGWAEPTWPLQLPGGEVWDRHRLEHHYGRWAELAQKGVGVHCGEGGAYSYTPHEVYLGWLREVMEVLQGYGIGYALWNFRGSFGILDSKREDVAYEDWHGHTLDRKALDLLRQF